jgi:tetratricopeptide (TPR) repeat protein
LREQLGAGGMGEVWRAEGPGGPVALKLMLAEAGLTAARFEREARAALALEHPNVVRTFESGCLKDGSPFLAMELLAGESLEARLTRGPLGAAEAAHLVREAALGLAAAHAAGFVHRDVKPGNLFLCGEPGAASPAVKVLDFGLALETREVGIRETNPGLPVGTVAYMAPEQALGNQDEDARTDVWGLGATLFHALSGQPPFLAPTPVATLVRILSGAPDPLPTDAPPALSQAVLCALERDRQRRFASMAAMAEALLLVAPEVAAKPVTEPMAVLTDEVRLLSVLLAEGVHDLEGFAEEVLRQGGTASGLRGRRAVGIFGGDAWQGDEPERAVRAALRARSHAARLAVGTNRAARGASGAVTGAAVHAAEVALARVRAGQVGADNETLRRVHGSFDTEGSRVLAARKGIRSAAAREIGGVDVPMFGRDVELRRLTDRYERCVSEPRALASVVVGPPGIGKSRLRNEFGRWIWRRPERVLTFEARGEAHRSKVPLAALAVAVRARGRILEGMPPEEARARILELCASARLPADLAQGTAEFLGEWLGSPFPDSVPLRTARSDPGIMRDRIRLAAGDLFEGFCRLGPVVIVLEDAHWADSLSLSYLDFLLGRLAERPLLVVATARPELYEERPAALESAERIVLREIGDGDIAAIVMAVLGRPEPTIVERAAGNPFFAEELSHAVQEGAASQDLPLTVHGAVQARLDNLSAAGKDLLKRAAVLGRRFWVEALVAIGVPEPEPHLRALRRRELASPRPAGSLAGCAEWLFRHAVVQEVSRDMLTDEQARGLHRLAAGWLVARPDAPAEDIAGHYEAAGDPGAATPFWMRAVQDADRRGDSTRVIELASHLVTRPIPPADALALRLALAEAMIWLGRYEDARVELDEARAAEASPSSALESIRGCAAARLLASIVASRTGRHDEAMTRAREAVVLARRTSDSGLETRTQARLALVAAHAGRHEEAARALEAASVLGSTEAMACALTVEAEGQLLALKGDKGAGLALAKEASRRFSELGDVRRAVASAVSAGARGQAVGALGEARERLESALRDARRLALRPLEGWALQNLGLVLHRLGETRSGLVAIEAAVGLGRELSDRRLVSSSLIYRVLILGESGEPAAAIEVAEQGLGDTELGAVEPQGWNTVLGLALLAAGRAPEALSQCARALAARDAQGGMEELEIELLLCKRDALVALDRPAEAEVVVADARRALDAKLARIEDEKYRRTFCRNIPAHARLLALRSP